jgi:CRP/FNR family cyclic AMP-dependent transcriptional regulator
MRTQQTPLIRNRPNMVDAASGAPAEARLRDLRLCNIRAMALQAPGCTVVSTLAGVAAGQLHRIGRGGDRVVATMGLEATVDRLQGVDLLRNCTDAQLQEVARLAERVQVAEGEILAREGRIGREFFLILSGSVAVTQMGRRVNTLGSGDFFGELAAMDPGPRNATVTALTDVDVLIIGPRELSAMSDIPGFRGALFRSMASRLRMLEARLAELLEAQDS